MSFTQGSRTGLTYITENSFGVTPSAPSMTDLPFKTHSLALSKERLSGADIQSDRIPRVDRHGNKQVGGDINVDLRAVVYDDLLESAFFSTFDTSGVMTPGTTPKFLTIEDGMADVGRYYQFLGCAVSQMSMRVAPNTMVETTFSVVGQQASVENTSLDSSPTAASSEEPFDSYSGSINEGGSSIAIVTGIDMTLDNSLQPTFVVGSDISPQLEYGRSVITGTLRAYFEDEALINKFINETESSLEFVLDDPATGNTYTFLLPRIKYNGGDLPVQNPQSRILTLPFVALYDDTEQTHLKLTKS